MDTANNDDDLAKYRSYRDTVRRFLLLSGVWPKLEQTCVPYRVLTLANGLLLLALGVKVLCYCFEHVADISIFFQTMSTAFSFLSSVLKILTYQYYREELKSLNDELGGKYEEELSRRVEHRPLLLRRVSVFRRFVHFAAGFTGAALVAFTALPLVYIFKYKKLVQIYKGRYPFPVTPGSPLYWAVVSLESLSMLPTWCIVCGVDNDFGLHCFRVCGLLRSLGQRFRELGDHRADYRRRLRDCVTTHRLLLDSKERLQRVYGLVVMWTYATSAVIMCSILYQADKSMKYMTVTHAVFFVTYMGVKLLQAFTYAYYGSLVSQESEECQNAIYESAWAGSGDLRLMRDVLIVQSQRPMVLKAKGFFVITMQMFEKIVNTTISYFFLLQTVTNEK